VSESFAMVVWASGSGEGEANGGDVSSIGACRPMIFFINGFLCFLEDEWQRNGEGRERGDATSRRR